MKKLFYGCLFSFMLIACHNNQENEMPKAMADIAMEEEMIPITRQAGPGELGQLTDNQYYKDKKIIKDASIGVEVKDFEDYRKNLDVLVKALNGYISNENLTKNDYYIKTDVSIRIPSANFEQFTNGLESGLEKLLYKKISARDVTEEFIDVEARIKTKKEVENRYIQLLSKAKNIKEILEVEEKIRVLREEIESKEGRLNYLRNQVSFSTINLSITKNFEYIYQPEKEKSFIQQLFKSLDKGWKGLIAFIIVIFRIWPLLIIGFISYYFIRKYKKTKKQNKNK